MSVLPPNATKPTTISDVVKHETDRLTGRRAARVLAGSGAARLITLGMVVAVITAGAVTSAAKAGGNTGNGTLTLDATAPAQSGAKVGVYTVRCIAAATNSGTFRVEDPDGFVLGDVAVGATFSDDIKFVIADGSADFAVGDGFDITVAAGSGKVVQYSPTGTGGAEIPAGVALDEVSAADGSDSTEDLVFLSRNAIVDLDQLVWPAGISATQKTAALAALARLGITGSAGV
jgi:hypothetical protein